jgi:hypothetical protein
MYTYNTIHTYNTYIHTYIQYNTYIQYLHIHTILRSYSFVQSDKLGNQHTHTHTHAHTHTPYINATTYFERSSVSCADGLDCLNCPFVSKINSIRITTHHACCADVSGSVCCDTHTHTHTSSGCSSCAAVRLAACACCHVRKGMQTGTAICSGVCMCVLGFVSWGVCVEC